MTARKSVGETARHWVAPELPGVDLLRARYVRRVFIPHTHPTFVIAAITEGVEEFRHRGSLERAGAGGLALINPDVPHTGRAGVPEGWAYGALYPTAEVVDAVAAELLGLRGTAWFTRPVLHDPVAVRMVGQVLRAVEERQALAADSLLRLAVARLLKTAGGGRPRGVARDAGAQLAARARTELLDRLTDPPTLAELAHRLGTGPFALLRAFRARYGMPPHAWLTDVRVRRARELLDAGVRPAEAAVAVGFTDQSHLHRHFRRVVGVPPGAYQRERGARTYKTDR
ncbi:AraC family transcriptional regulator [Streptomyces sp. DSM 44915]|uniref:AraC family transcriptional regulator n=1 Tax=Streptomyces chisholmiae TaxID=3075540 RepID=A0ABU2JPL8_9ACTN|nr:AraC family transcriptional regulator [Streptomyces sp. DSM 44915]MDT0266153.1 AraC family transcriptional regulator [Streptomyces sp. DSM 44915]